MKSPNKHTDFVGAVMGYYAEHGRDLPWRRTDDPYKILVSEIMLQQTQVPRVIPKYETFLERFPSTESLAAAPLSEVLKLWSGLGYNRRAKFLHEAAKQIAQARKFPRGIDGLVALPGVGVNTAAAVLTYALNQKHVFIETNVRTCIFYHFFSNKKEVTDKQITEVMKKILHYVDSPREFYWALMDYGTHLKAAGNNISTSKHYTKQSPFEGSKRQVRGMILKLLADRNLTKASIIEKINDQRTQEVLSTLEKEGLISKERDHYSLG